VARYILTGHYPSLDTCGYNFPTVSNSALIPVRTVFDAWPIRSEFSGQPLRSTEFYDEKTDWCVPRAVNQLLVDC
jgi:hypothetical protein